MIHVLDEEGNTVEVTTDDWIRSMADSQPAVLHKPHSIGAIPILITTWKVLELIILVFALIVMAGVGFICYLCTDRGT